MTTIGKIRRLQKCGTQHGHFVMFALDHRGNLRRALNPAKPEEVTYEQMVTFKLHLTSVISPTASGLLLDPEYGAAPAIANGAVAPSCGLLVAVEQTGYTGDPLARQSQLLPGWSVEKISRIGADGVKLLIYYHPDAANAAEQEALISEVAESCQKYDMPLFLEPLSFSLDPKVKTLPSSEKSEVVVETARRLTPLGVDVLKAEFPLNIGDEPDEAVWAEACAELSQATTVPWVLLSAGVGFQDFARQTKIACQAGASGVLAGRAIWKEAADMDEAERDIFLRITATERMGRLAAIIRAYGRAWTTFYPGLSSSVKEGWYKHY
jgi:tagatose 1,6-diphosphate aldolase